jgi:hypothetical protein
MAYGASLSFFKAQRSLGDPVYPTWCEGLWVFASRRSLSQFYAGARHSISNLYAAISTSKSGALKTARNETANRQRCSMRRSKLDFLELMASGTYYALQKRDDRNREDICLRREDGLAAEIHNYPYRINQIPAYIFDEFVREGLLKADGTDELGGTIFRTIENERKRAPRAA